jgi:hypothetical protein
MVYMIKHNLIKKRYAKMSYIYLENNPPLSTRYQTISNIKIKIYFVYVKEEMKFKDAIK